jgi:hypothetical protein
MPGADHGPSILNPKVYEALRTKRGMSKRRAAMISNARRHKDSGVTGLAIPPHGPDALFNQPGIGGGTRAKRRMRRRQKAFNWGAHVGQTISGALTRGAGGRFAGSGQPSPRTTGAAAQKARREAMRATRQQRVDDRTAAHEAEAAQEAQTRATEDSYIAAGKTGAERQHRRAEIAAKRRERSAARLEAHRQEASTERATRQQEDDAESKTRATEAAAGKGGGGGGGGKKKPTPAEKQAAADKAKAEQRAKTAPRVGLSTAEAETLAAVAGGGSAPPAGTARMRSLGLLDDTGATDQGRRLLAALERGDVRGALAAIQDGKAHVARAAAGRTSATQRAADKQKKAAERTAAQKQRAADRAAAQAKRDAEKRAPAADKKPFGYHPPSPGNPPAPPPPPINSPAAEQQRNQTPAAQAIRTMSERRQHRRRHKEQTTFGGTTRGKLDDSVFAGPDRSFPVVTAQDVRDAVRSLGRTTHDKDAVRRGIIRRARAIGAMDALPDDWRSAPVLKQDDQEKAMFAAMGGGGGGGGSKGGGGGGKLWPKGPSGKRTPQAAAARGSGGNGGAKPKVTTADRQRSATARRLRDKRDEIQNRMRHNLDPTKQQALHDYYRQLDDEVQNYRRSGHISAADAAPLRDSQSSRKRTKSFTVFKDAGGADRWLAITTTAYEDKDQEWISRKAIRAVVAAGDAGTPRGPLRYWHVPGLDLGDCDYQAALDDGRLLIESGTFRSPAAARVGQKAAAAGYQMSPGFLHTRQQPRGGVFDRIALTERSFVPPGRASNPYTRLLTKETDMLTDEKRKAFEALAGDEASRALLQTLLDEAAATTKAADAAGAIFKDAPAWAQALITRIDDLELTMKAFPPKAAPADATATDPSADPTAALDANLGLGDGGDGTDPSADPNADPNAQDADAMDDQAFADMIARTVVQALGPLLDLEKKLSGHLSDLKAAVGGAAPPVAKDDTRATELAALDARLKELEGGRPRARTSLATQTWGDLTGVVVTKEQAAALSAQTPGGETPAGLNAAEAGAYRLIFGE